MNNENLDANKVDKSLTELKNSVTEFVLFILIIPLSAMLRGFTLHMLWGWFLIQFISFHPNYIHCIGISLIATFLQPSSFKFEEKSKVNALISIAWVLFKNLFTLLIGFIIKSFMG